jgi:hypothetical protein
MIESTEESVFVDWHIVWRVFLCHASLHLKDWLSFSLLSSHGIKIGVKFHIQLTKEKLTACHHSSVKQFFRKAFGTFLPAMVRQ